MKDAGHILRVNVAERRRRLEESKRPGSGSLQAVEGNFLSQYSSYFSRLKELGEERPAHVILFCVPFLSR